MKKTETRVSEAELKTSKASRMADAIMTAMERYAQVLEGKWGSHLVAFVPGVAVGLAVAERYLSSKMPLSIGAIIFIIISIQSLVFMVPLWLVRAHRRWRTPNERSEPQPPEQERKPR